MPSNGEELDSYSAWVPIDNDLIKSIEIDENGDYIVQGVMTADNLDEEDDSIAPEGMDCSYFLDKGWVKYEHGNNPQQFIGEPLEVKIGQFTHPTRHEVVNGIFVKTRLFANRKLAQEAIQTMQDLQKSNTKRTMGWSIEGNVLKRNSSGKVVRSVLRNLVLTMNPVNTITWAELAKSFAKNHELTINMEKSMDTAGAAAIMPQSLEGGTQDPQRDWLKLFREFCRSNFLQKSLRDEFVAGSRSAVGTMTYTFALENGLDNEEAYTFASYILDKQAILKSIFSTNFGGGAMAKTKDLAGLLDADLEELRKSLDLGTEDDDQLTKSTSKGKDGSKEHEDAETDDEEDDEHESGDEGEDEPEEDNMKEKSLQMDFRKSLTSSEENAQALEVSDFLSNMVDELGYSMDGLSKSLGLVSKQQMTMTKALIGAVDVIKSLSEKVEAMQTDNSELKKSLDGVMNLPIGRKGATSQRDITTLKKSLDGKGELTRKQAGDILMKSFDAKLIPGSAVTRFEAGTPLQNLGLPDSVKAELGMQ